MFRKLVSNLPFSPSLINQLAFYSKRLKKEQFTRRLGLIFTILAVVIQTMTFISPSQATLAASRNDIIYNGNGKTKQGIVQAYFNNRDQLGRTDIRTIFNHYGVTAENLNSSRVVTIRSSTANNYWSIGRNPRGYGGEIAVQISGGPRVYSRTLHGWAANRNWSALEVNTAQGKRWILLECGNIVTQNIEKPKTPNLQLTKSVDKTTAKKGEKVTFTIKVSNIGQGTAKNTYIYDDAPAGLDLLNDGLGTQPIKNSKRWETKRFDIGPGASFTYKINALVNKWGPGTEINRACVDIIDSNIYNNCDTAEVTLVQGCPISGKETLALDDPSCKTNPNLKIEKTTPNKNLKIGDSFEYTLKINNTGDVAIPKAVVRDIAPEHIQFTQVKEVGENTFKAIPNPRDYTSSFFPLAKKASATIVLKAKVLKASENSIKNTACVLSTGADTTTGGCDDETITVKEVCPSNPSVAKDSAQCNPCPVAGKENIDAEDAACQPCEEGTGEDQSCTELHKSARNITQQIQNANGTKANPGDSIEYTLSVKNRGKTIHKAFVIEENMDDVLEYADIIDANGATFSESPVKMLTWSPVDIRPNETISRTVLVKIKSPLPSTPASTSDPLSYDLKMVNVYGDTVQIELPNNPVKTVEQTVNSLPSTGPGLSIGITTTVLVLATYFFFRSRLMNKELGLVRQQFNYGTGV